MKFLENHSLTSLHGFKVPALARYYVQLHNTKDVTDFCTAINTKNNDLFILGGGSNTLFFEDFHGYVLHMQLPGIEVMQETNHQVWIKAGAGVMWHTLVEFCIDKGYGGIENLSFIPGTVGAAPIQNIGAYGVALQDVLECVETIELCSGKKRNFNRTACDFGYRTSIFKTKLRNQYVITAIVLVLHKEQRFSIAYKGIQEKLEDMQVHKPCLKTISEAIIALRKEKLPPPYLGNLGSFFENPIIPIHLYRELKERYPWIVGFPTQNQNMIKISAAWLIETAGFKGFRDNHVGVYDLHALVLVHYGGGTGRELLNLADRIRDKVADLFNILLTTEVNIIP